MGTTPPRPFVLRCRNLDGHSYSAGEVFSFGLNLFVPDLDVLQALPAALTAMGDAGFGPTRSRATLLLPPEHTRHSIQLDQQFESTREVRVHFHTPTELKSDGQVCAPGSFAVLFAQLYARLNRLSALYGSGEIWPDEKALRMQAASIASTSARLSRVEVSRRSRLGQTHPIGGFVGWVDYSGDLTSFVPLLEAASFAGVGRHTVWGNGEISIEILG